MAAVSNGLFIVMIFGYAVAMALYAAEYAFGPRGAVARVAQRPPVRELVGAGGPPAVEDAAGKPSARPARRSGPGRAALAGRAAVAVTAAAAAVHIGSLVARGIAAGRVPWGNMYEFIVAVCLVAAVAWLGLVIRRPTVRPLGLFVTVALVLLLGAAGMTHTEAAPLVPALNSYWLKIHVSAAIIASGMFLVGAVTAAIGLIRGGHDAGKRRFPYTLGWRLPEADGLERLAFRLHAFAFPIWTFAIICGAIWAEAAWDRYWGWDPKETWSFIAWVIYAGYLHARATPSVRRTTATWIALAGWGAMMINLFGVNLVVSGLHSYAGV